MAPQAPIQPRPRHIRVEKLPRHRQKLVERQQKKAAQRNDHHFLRCRQRRLQTVRGGRQVLNAATPLPLARRLLAHPVAQRQNCRRFVAPRHPLTNDGGVVAFMCNEIIMLPAPPDTGMQPRDQITKRRPYDEQWQTAGINAMLRDGTAIAPNRRLIPTPVQLTCAQLLVVIEVIVFGSLAKRFQAVQQAWTIAS